MNRSEDQRIAKELQRERNFVNAVLDNAGALVVLDRDGRIRRFNRACEELTQYAFAEVEGGCLGLLPDHGRAGGRA